MQIKRAARRSPRLGGRPHGRRRPVFKTLGRGRRARLLCVLLVWGLAACRGEGAGLRAAMSRPFQALTALARGPAGSAVYPRGHQDGGAGALHAVQRADAVDQPVQLGHAGGLHAGDEVVDAADRVQGADLG